MKLKYLIILTLIFLFGSCSTWKNAMVVKGNQNDAVKNAIMDFLHTSRLAKKDSIFSISIKSINKDIFGVSIFGARNKISVVTENEVDYSYRSFPTKYFEQDGKLFYWIDSTENVSIELINKLSKMNRIDTAIVGKYFPERSRDDSQKGVDYYFCKSDLKKYKKVSTNMAIGWYEPPKLECSQ